MRYKLLNKVLSADTNVFEVENKTVKIQNPDNLDDKEDLIDHVEVITTPTDKYFVNIELHLQDTGSTSTSHPEGFLFTENIVVTSDNSQTGFEVDEQRALAITEFLTQINK